MMSCRTITQGKRDRLRRLESIIDAGVAIWHRVGQALMEIIRDRLFELDGFRSADAYLRSKTQWQFGPSHAYRLIAAADVAADLSPIGENLPANEAQARELVPLSPEGRREVWQEATAGGTEGTTAARLRELTAKALASLPPEEQKEAIQLSESSILEHAREARQEGGEGRGQRLAQIGRLCRRVRKLVLGLGPESEGPLALLDRFAAAVALLSEAAA